jgi:hypothetical protein
MDIVNNISPESQIPTPSSPVNRVNIPKSSPQKVDPLDPSYKPPPEKKKPPIILIGFIILSLVLVITLILVFSINPRP